MNALSFSQLSKARKHFSASSLIASFTALALAAIVAGPASASMNAPNTSNNAPNPLAVDQTAVGDFTATGDIPTCLVDRAVFDRHGNSLGRAMVNICK